VNFRTFSIITFVVVVGGTFAYMMWQRKNQAEPVSVRDAAQSSPVEVPATATGTATASAPPGRQQFRPPPTAMLWSAATQRPAASNSSAPGEETPEPPLPIAFHIRDLRSLNRIEGELLNVSSKPLSVTLQDVNPGAQGTSELQLDLAPGETKSYSTDDGLIMTARDQLILHSPGFKDRVVRVP